jgi:DNA-binding beta-propeller fold protein YncE
MKRVASLLGAFLLLGVLAGCGGGSSTSTTPPPPPPPLPAGTELLYVGDNVGMIHGFGVDPGSGKLTPLSSVAVTNGAAAGDVGLAADSGGMILYATSDGLGGPNVTSFLVDKQTGTLTPNTGQTMPVPPRKLAAAPGGGTSSLACCVYVIPDQNANAAQLFAFNINKFNGGLTLAPNQPFTLPGVPREDIAVTPSGNWIGVPFEGTSGGEIAGIGRDPNTGVIMLLPSPISPTSTGGDEPGGIRVTPDGKFVVVVNQATNSVSVFSLNSVTGALTEVSGSPFATGNNPDPVAIDPSGKFVFVGNRGAGSLSAYTIDSAGGLTPVTGTPIQLAGNSQPSSIAVDPAGKFVYVSIVPQQVAGFALDPNTGVLTPITGSPFSVGAVTRDMVFIP